MWRWIRWPRIYRIHAKIGWRKSLEGSENKKPNTRSDGESMVKLKSMVNQWLNFNQWWKQATIYETPLDSENRQKPSMKPMRTERQRMSAHPRERHWATPPLSIMTERWRMSAHLLERYWARSSKKHEKKTVCRPQTEFPGHPLTGCRAKNRWPWDFFQHWVSHWHHGDHPFKDDRQGSTPPRQRGAIQHYPSPHDRI